MVGSAVYYLHQDALGSTRLETTASVTVTFSSNYVPYGQNYAVSGKEVSMYTGKPLDSVTGLYYFGARYYDDAVGRFVTEDSYEGDKNDPMTLNQYVYARDNPEKYEDVTGHIVSYRSYTDTDESEYLTTTETCVNGVCTVTTTESYGGYTSSISTTTGTTKLESGSTLSTGRGTILLPSGTTETAMSTVFTDTYPQNGGTSVATTSWTATYTTPTGTQTTVSSMRTDSISKNQAECDVIVIGGDVAISIAALGLPVDYPLFAGTVGAEGAVIEYTKRTPNPDPQAALESYAVGFTISFVAAFIPWYL